MYLYLVRHGLSAGNAGGYLQGWMDTDLMPEGREQARKTAEFFARYAKRDGLKFTAIHTSPLKRARITAQAIGKALNLRPLIDPDLREMGGGQVEGKTLEQWQSAFPELIPGWADRANMDFGWPGGETRAAFRDRTLRAINKIVVRYQPYDNVVVVTHGGFIRSYLRYSGIETPEQQMEFSAGNCSITHVRYDRGETWVGCLVDFNQQSHLRDDIDVSEVANVDLALL